MRNFFFALPIVSVLCSASVAEEPAPGKQVEQTLSLGENRSISYLLYLPKDYSKGTKQYPVMLFLHGRGESDGPLSIVKKWGPPRRVEHGDDLPFILVSPQCPRTTSWNDAVEQELLLDLLEHVSKTYGMDADRIYLTGLSMGGYGSWKLAASHPEKFAAIVPICGAGRIEDAAKLKWLPIWVFHGTEDNAVPFKESQQMFEAVKGAGSETIRFTSLEWIGHNSWEAAYASPELYEWLAKQTASRNRGRASGNASASEKGPSQ